MLLADIRLFLFCAGMLVSPETPAFLMSKGRRSDAEASAKALWGAGFKQELYGASQTVDAEPGTFHLSNE